MTVCANGDNDNILYCSCNGKFVNDDDYYDNDDDICVL